MQEASAVRIGIFDSGVGGLSVLAPIRAALPQAQLLYFSDAGCAPYGDKPGVFIQARCIAIVRFLREHGAQAIVIACNSATAAAVHALRAIWPALPIIGVEPGIKPALQCSSSKRIGVLATTATLQSSKFQQLLSEQRQATAPALICQACPGLADAIEFLGPNHARTRALLAGYVLPLLGQGVDTLVLGCTHYPFITHVIADLARTAGYPEPRCIDTAEAICRQLLRRLHDIPAVSDSDQPYAPRLCAYTSGDTVALERAFHALLDMDCPVHFCALPM